MVKSLQKERIAGFEEKLRNFLVKTIKKSGMSEISDECCRVCLSSEKLLSILSENLLEKINSYLPISINENDSLTKNICYNCSNIIKSFDRLYKLASESNEKLQKLLESKNRREELDLAEALNFNTTQDDGSDKSLEIPPSIEIDIDRILAMTQLDENDISGAGTSQIYNCEFCQPSPPIATLIELNEHLKAVHIDLVFHCETCDNFIGRNALIEHMLQHLKEMGEEPAATENENKNDKTDPVIENNEDQEKDQEPEPEAKPHKDRKYLLKEASGPNVKFLKKCFYCPKMFSNRSGRLYHQEQAHLNRRRFTCDQCDLSFGLKQTLMNHIRNKHSNNVRSFQCDLCEKTYKTKSALHNHKVYHSNDDPKYHCNYCPKKFHFNFLLQQHETIHLGLEKTYDCDVCKKSFNTRNKLTKHRGIHDTDNQFACQKEGCNFKGNLKRYLIAHTKRMHS